MLKVIMKARLVIAIVKDRSNILIVIVMKILVHWDIISLLIKLISFRVVTIFNWPLFLIFNYLSLLFYNIIKLCTRFHVIQ